MSHVCSQSLRFDARTLGPNGGKKAGPKLGQNIADDSGYPADMAYRLFLKGSTAQRVQDDRIRDGDPPFERDILEVTFMRERMKVRVVFVHSPDAAEAALAEVTVEQVR